MRLTAKRPRQRRRQERDRSRWPWLPEKTDLAAARVVREEDLNGAGGRLIRKMFVVTKYTKLYVMALGLGAALGALGYRLVDLQIARHGEFQALAQQNTVRTIERRPVRGQILDIKGTPLARSEPAKVICADPTLIGPLRQGVAHILA